MTALMNNEYRRYTGPISIHPMTAWWPITRSELTARFLKWRFVLLYLVAFGPFLFRAAILYARFVVAPVHVGVMSQMTSSRMSRLMQWDQIYFYSDYLEDRFLWIFLLFAAAVLGVPMVARDLRTRAWELYFSRAIATRDYLLGKFVAVFLVLFALTWGGVVSLYLMTALLGPDEGFFLRNLGWLFPLTCHSMLMSSVLALTALAFGTLSRNGIILAGSWLGTFFFAFAISRVMRFVQHDGAYDWIDPRNLFLKASSVFHDRPPVSSFPPWLAFGLLVLITTGALLVLFRFLRLRLENIG